MKNFLPDFNGGSKFFILHFSFFIYSSFFTLHF